MSKKQTLTDKELLRRIKITKPCTVKRMVYGLMYIARKTGITIGEFK